MAKKYSKKELEKQLEYENKNKSYHLHNDAIERLVTADKDTAPEVPKEVLRDYKKGGLSQIPTWLKALFIKFWFNGAVCFFFIWGLGVYVKNSLDLVLVTAIAMGIVTDILVNNLLNFLDMEGEYNKWAVIPKGKFWTFFVNILYAFVVMCVVVLSYNGINQTINGITGADRNITNFMVEPFSFGLLYLAVDLIFVGLKTFIKKLISDANKKLSEKERENNNLGD